MLNKNEYVIFTSHLRRALKFYANLKQHRQQIIKQ